MLWRSIVVVVGIGLGTGWLPVQAQARKMLDIYVIDVEGGEATLFVSPTGESMLVDAGWPGFNGRDADRIAAAAKDAGVRQIDHLVISHFHPDHMEGAEQLSTRLPIRRFIDHGTTADRDASSQTAFQTYVKVRETGTHHEAKAGDVIPVAGLDVRIIASGGVVLRTPLPGGGSANPLCASFTPHGPEITSRVADAEDQRSLSAFVRYGSFRTAIMGDLTWNKEYDLMCPANPLGTVDVYLVSHHGSDTSGAEVLVHALRPRVAIMNNGPRKGGAVQTFRILRASPGLEDLWQNHYSIPGGGEHNRPNEFIANLDDGTSAGVNPSQVPVHMGPAHWIKVAASADGSFTVTNGRTGFVKRYPARK
jgi:beta-lactamase superfamily II metal-dependent hydrolase